MAPGTGWASQLWERAKLTAVPTWAAGALTRGLCTGPDAPLRPHPHTPGLGTAEW